MRRPCIKACTPTMPALLEPSRCGWCADVVCGLCTCAGPAAPASSPFPALDAHLKAEMAAQDPLRGQPHRILSVCTHKHQGDNLPTLYFSTTSHACAFNQPSHDAISNNGIVYAVNVVDCMYWKVCMHPHTGAKPMQHAKPFDAALLQWRVDPHASLRPWLATWGSKLASNASSFTTGLRMR
jgi:hypothetical protein